MPSESLTRRAIRLEGEPDLEAQDEGIRDVDPARVDHVLKIGCQVDIRGRLEHVVELDDGLRSPLIQVVAEPAVEDPECTRCGTCIDQCFGEVLSLGWRRPSLSASPPSGSRPDEARPPCGAVPDRASVRG